MPSILHFQKQLRNNQTDCESILWYYLRAKRLRGFKFRRQYRIANYIVDFVCVAQMLVIEVDGSQHQNNRADIQRDQFLVECGYKVLRFWNNEVIENIDGVILKILKELDSL